MKKYLLFFFALALLLLLPLRVYNIPMATEVWGLLPKSQEDNETVEEAIDRIVATHEAEPTAHTGDNESLSAHRVSAVIDHLAKSIVEDKLADLAVSTRAIANAAVTGGKIANTTITAANITDATITGSKIASATIAGSNIASATIAAGNITDATITGSKIASGTISATNIANATITSAQISGTAGITGGQIASATITSSNISGTAGITGGQIASATISASNIANNTITATQIANNTITAGQIANTTITATQIANNTITGGQIANGTITTTQISGTAGITGGQIASGTVQAGNITDLTITAGKIANLTITSSQIANSTITGTKVAQNTITGGASGNLALLAVTADNIAANTITAAKIAADTITANEIAANAITSNELNAAAVTSDKITTSQITGKDFRTAANVGSGTSGVKFTSAGIEMWDGTDQKVNIPTSGDPTFAGILRARELQFLRNFWYTSFPSKDAFLEAGTGTVTLSIGPLTIQSGSTTNNIKSFYGQDYTGEFIDTSSKDISFETGLKLVNTTSVEYVFGINMVAGAPDNSNLPNGISFEVISNKLYAVKYRDDGTRDATEIQAATPTGYHRYRVDVDAGTSIKYYVDGVLEHEYTTNLPAIIPAFPFGYSVKTTANAAKYMYVVYLSIETPFD